jgi:hypothetical protein
VVAKGVFCISQIIETLQRHAKYFTFSVPFSLLPGTAHCSELTGIPVNWGTNEIETIEILADNPMGVQKFF